MTIRNPISIPAFLIVAVALVCSACSRGIGDSCTANVECSPLGDRICDLTQSQGYCTIEACDQKSCPKEAVCVAFFPEAFLTVNCNPSTEDAIDPAIIPTNVCAPDERCLPSGKCAHRSLERRFCMRQCSSDKNCRSGYQCRPTGVRGSDVLIDPDRFSPDQAKFCVQIPFEQRTYDAGIP